jgi:hypothetical protein
MRLDWFGRIRVAAIAGALAIACSPVCASRLVSQNLGAGHYTASSSYDNNVVPSVAFDGNHGSAWNSGSGAPGWIEVDLGRLYPLCEIRLDLSRSGQPSVSTHEIWISSSPIGNDRSHATLAYTFNQTTSDHSILDALLPSNPMDRYVQVRTTQVASWVAMYECEVYTVPEPSSVLTLLCAVGGLAGFVWKRKR